MEVDSTRLRQVLWNLLSNAMKFTKEGGVVMTVSAECDAQHAEITIEVEDTGIGIPEAEQEKSLPCIIRSSQAKITYMRWALASA